ncbi:MAG: DUF4255 domain-containing protein [Rhodospirillales bacterium]|nr:MAG: DUF4255 domain-containing protein [Rhodospirillales bacterium]
MSLLNLSLVTRAFSELIARRVELSPAWQPRPRPTVSPLPLDQLSGAGLSFYLYHVNETPQSRNPPPPDTASDATRYQPMGLELNFQMSPAPAGPSASELHEAQLLFGCALKVLHDDPEINDETEVAGARIFEPLGLLGARNRFRAQLIPVSPSDAVNYWTAGSTAMRLAAYYAVSVVHLDPEPVTARAGRVFTYSISAFPSDQPFVTASDSRVDFTLPDGTPQTISVSPAAVAYGGVLTLTGSGFVGQRIDLLIRGGGDAAPRVADQDWAVVAQPTRLTATVRRTIDGRVVLPGPYLAMVRTTRIRNDRPITAVSNAVAIQIVPAVDALTPLGGGLFRIDGGPFADPALLPEQVELRLGAERLSRSVGVPAAGQFQIIDSDRIEFRIPAGLVPGQDLPLRIHVNGAESPPRFLRVP